MLTPHKPSNYYYNCLAIDLPGKDGRKEEATSQQHIQLRLQTHFDSLLSYALLQQYVVLVSSNKSTISFQRSALCNEGKKKHLKWYLYCGNHQIKMIYLFIYFLLERGLELSFIQAPPTTPCCVWLESHTVGSWYFRSFQWNYDWIIIHLEVDLAYLAGLSPSSSKPMRMGTMI